MKHCLKLLIPCAALVAGCATGTGGWEVSLDEGRGEVRTLRVDDDDFAEILVVEQARIRRASSGFVMAEVDVRNTDDDDFAIQYRFVFHTAGGFPVQPGSRAWEQLVIHGGESRTLTATAPTKDAVGYLVRARRITQGE